MIINAKGVYTRAMDSMSKILTGLNFEACRFRGMPPDHVSVTPCADCGLPFLGSYDYPDLILPRKT